jgi:hypothetical protein
MWGTWNGRNRTTVVCVACGTSVTRSQAREYDKEGNRWERQDKQFEHLCKECYRGLCHQPRDDLEALLVEIESAGQTESEFLSAYFELVCERYGSVNERETD